jgi:hypothetical protein
MPLRRARESSKFFLNAAEWLNLTLCISGSSGRKNCQGVWLLDFQLTPDDIVARRNSYIRCPRAFARTLNFYKDV